jgi:hypothetical protein
VARAPQRVGTLKVLVRPFGFVAINGGKHVEVPGAKQLPLRPGSYQVELFDNHDLSVKQLSVTVEAGATLTVEAD